MTIIYSSGLALDERTAKLYSEDRTELNDPEFTTLRSRDHFLLTKPLQYRSDNKLVLDPRYQFPVMIHTTHDSLHASLGSSCWFIEKKGILLNSTTDRLTLL